MAAPSLVSIIKGLFITYPKIRLFIPSIPKASGPVL